MSNEKTLMNESLKYVKLYNWARTLILSGVMKNGDKLPSEHMLQKKFGYSRQTVRTALDVLEHEGLISRVRGSGTFVSYETGISKSGRQHIGLIMSYFADYMFPQVYEGIESVMHDRGIEIDVTVTRNNLNDEAVYLERFLNSNVCGLIVEGTRSTFPNPNIRYYKELLNRGIPIIFIHNHYSNLECSSVEMADARCSYELTEQLIENGHERIGGIFKYDDLQGIERYRGFMECMSDHNLPINDECIKWYSTKDLDFQFSKKSLSHFLKQISECTALMTYNDEIAETFIEFAETRDMHIPDDLSIVSFDSAAFTDNDNNDLHLTSAVHPKYELGRRAARNLLRMIENPQSSRDNSSYRFPVSISNGNSIRDIR